MVRAPPKDVTEHSRSIKRTMRLRQSFERCVSQTTCFFVAENVPRICRLIDNRFYEFFLLLFSKSEFCSAKRARPESLHLQSRGGCMHVSGG